MPSPWDLWTEKLLQSRNIKVAVCYIIVEDHFSIHCSMAIKCTALRYTKMQYIPFQYIAFRWNLCYLGTTTRRSTIIFLCQVSLLLDMDVLLIHHLSLPKRLHAASLLVLQ